MLKDKKILAGGAVLFLAAFWFYIKPNYMDAKPAPVITQEQIDASPHPTVMLGKPVGEEKKGNAPEGLVLNLKAPANAPRYVKVIMALEFERPKEPWLGVTGDALTAKNVEFTHHLEHEMPKILDAVATVFGSKSAEEIGSTEGREKLKEDLIEAINEHLPEEKVEAIYFETLITQ
ncbi:MAG TPA: flagellar basal body-associated FliL family protein [Tepidiformaceae bacterium]|nr:flagellar basal body-associated FliL family protein [Tepidiformaceae bacterium]HNO66823.1 flagellar basal body-associated FliL family protein [Tepidiformaceae bacterium]